MSSKIKLGLDIGTNSIGWAVLEKSNGKYDFVKKEDQNGNIIPSKGVYIFPKATGKKEQSKAAIRRSYRSPRRNRINRRKRKIKTLSVLAEFDMCPAFNRGELNRWKKKKEYPSKNSEFIAWQRTGKGKKTGNAKTEKLKQPYFLRHLAATKKGMMETPKGRHQLGRAFYHIAQRRGYLSNGEDEQTEDKLELFKQAIRNLLERYSTTAEIYEALPNLKEKYKSNKKANSLAGKIKRKLKENTSFEEVKKYTLAEFNKPNNFGKVQKDIYQLDKEIKKSDHPTMGSYFNSIYAKERINKEGKGLIYKIRNRYTHREKHYEKEFNYICDKQGIKNPLRKKLHNAIFYQRPLKSQKGLVAKCPLEPKRKRIALSHPLFEEFRMWESLNRIKMKQAEEKKLQPLSAEEKELIKPSFKRKSDFEFSSLAKKLSNGKPYNYIKRPEVVYINGKKVDDVKAEILFNFPMDKKFSTCPVTYDLKNLLGKEYDKMPFLNTGYKKEKGKKQVSIEDAWHCLFLDVFGEKDKSQGRKEFAEKHLNLNKDALDKFIKIKLPKGYGNLSKSAIKKILPFLREGERYDRAVFLGNMEKVIGRELANNEKKDVISCIKNALDVHSREKKINGIVNHYIEIIKNNQESLGDNKESKDSHKKSLYYEMIQWIGEESYSNLSEAEEQQLKTETWNRFEETAMDKGLKDVAFCSTITIPELIKEELQNSFEQERIDTRQLFHPSAIEQYKPADKKLGSPEISSIKNPTFNKAMHQVKRLVNELIKKGLVDKKTEVNIEFAREINSSSYQLALARWQKDQEIIRNWSRKKIIESYPEERQKDINPTQEDITKYILFSEQSGKCLYTGETIGICEFLGGKTVYDIEHTIPRSLKNDNSLKNKTLAHADFNRKQKQAELPANLNVNYKGKLITRESILKKRNANLRSYNTSNNEVHWHVKLSDLKEKLKRLNLTAKATQSDTETHAETMQELHYIKLKYDYLKEKYQNFELEEVPKKFTNANLVDTRIIAKYAQAYLNSYFKRVNVVNGKITDTLRKLWGLQGENEPKDRSNHIHHCIDAVTVACVEKGTANRISEAYHNYERDYFVKNQTSAKPFIYMRAPMENFAERMYKLHEEVLIYHKKEKNLQNIEQLTKESKRRGKIHSNGKSKEVVLGGKTLRGPLNSQNPYGHRKDKKTEDYYFVQREKVKNIKTKGKIESIVDDRIRERIKALLKDNNLKPKQIPTKLLKEDPTTKEEALLLPEYTAQNRKGEIVKSAPMVIKKVRVKSSKTKLRPYKEYREMDKSDYEWKQDYYFDKEAGSNFEARIYGDLIPNDKGSFENRSSKIINNYDIVKDIDNNEESQILFSIKRGDAFLIFDQHPDEIEWDNIKDLQSRLFHVVKFDENKKKSGVKQIILGRHNYAKGDVDHAPAISSEANLKVRDEVVIRRGPSTLRAVPTKIDVLGKVNMKYSKKFMEQQEKK